MKRFALVLAAATLCIGGCSTDHLLIHVQDMASGAPIAGASVELRPAIALLPPPVWRGKTNAQGDLHIWVDLDIGTLQMDTLVHDHRYEAMVSKDTLERLGALAATLRPYGGPGPEMSYTVRLIDPK